MCPSQHSMAQPIAQSKTLFFHVGSELGKKRISCFQNSFFFFMVVQGSKEKGKHNVFQGSSGPSTRKYLTLSLGLLQTLSQSGRSDFLLKSKLRLTCFQELRSRALRKKIHVFPSWRLRAPRNDTFRSQNNFLHVSVQCFRTKLSLLCTWPCLR